MSSVLPAAAVVVAAGQVPPPLAARIAAAARSARRALLDAIEAGCAAPAAGMQASGLGWPAPELCGNLQPYVHSEAKPLRCCIWVEFKTFDGQVTKARPRSPMCAEGGALKQRQQAQHPFLWFSSRAVLLRASR